MRKLVNWKGQLGIVGTVVTSMVLGGSIVLAVLGNTPAIFVVVSAVLFLGISYMWLDLAIARAFYFGRESVFEHLERRKQQQESEDSSPAIH